MQYPRPGPAVVGEWKGIAHVLLEQTGCQRVVLCQVYPSSIEPLIALPQDDYFDADCNRQREAVSLREYALTSSEGLCVDNLGDDARWDSSPERRSGVEAYIGQCLSWPDGEPFGTIELHFAAPLEEDDSRRHRALLHSLDTSLTLRLDQLYREELARYRATHDPLTGLANAHLFEELVGHHIERSRRSGDALWMLLLGLDDFPRLNKTLREEKSDLLLRRVAERTRDCVRRSDILARIGVDEFAVLLLEGNEFVATAVSDRVRRNIKRIRQETKGTPVVTLSCGISPYLPEEKPSAWLARCRRTLHEARSEGRDQVRVRPQGDRVPAGHS